MRVIPPLAVAAVAAFVACSSAPPGPPPTMTGGDPRAGLAAIDRYGCAACHVVPGVARAEASWVGPPLERYARRAYVAGVVLNNEANLVRWIMDPQSINPGTAMPNLDVSEIEARDIAAYLYTLD